MKIQYYPVVLLVLFLTASYSFGYTPALLAFVFVVASSVSFLVYAKDKSAAEKGKWRVPEKTLQLLSLFFGWPGAVIAQQALRHKTQKVNFKVVFWFTVVVNMAVVLWFHTGNGNAIFRRGLETLAKLVENTVIESTMGESSIVGFVMFLLEF